MIAALRAYERATRPKDPELEARLTERFDELPAHVRTPTQALGRRTMGCEGTHGVFPRCNLACTPCYHAKEANRVRVDGPHTLAEVDAQMALLRAHRGPGQNAQLIGGEVTLLAPDDHAAALLTMQRHGRKPMSLSHGDFDYDYLERLVLDPETGAVRLPHLSFAGHFDSMMYGRRGLKRVRRESELHEHRARFCQMFQRLEQEHGVTHYLAHNMTVTPRNVDQVAEVIRATRDLGFRMFSFQPAAFVGNTSRWKDSYRSVSGDDVWAQVERGAGARLPFRVLQIGDERCNRTAYGAVVGDDWVPILDDCEPRDHVARDHFFRTFGGMDFAVPPSVLAGRVVRAYAANPRGVVETLAWARRFAKRAGGTRRLVREKPRALTFVMHSFMDAAHVKPAWEALQRGEMPEEPEVRAAAERLQACSYAMSHPESGELVPACVQHSVLDPRENLRLTELLPLAPVS